MKRLLMAYLVLLICSPCFLMACPSSTPQVPVMIEGKPVLIDACIAPIVQALNDAGIATATSCCGHGQGDGFIMLKNNRLLIISPDGVDSRSRYFRDFEPMAARSMQIRDRAAQQKRMELIKQNKGIK